MTPNVPERQDGVRRNLIVGMTNLCMDPSPLLASACQHADAVRLVVAALKWNGLEAADFFCDGMFLASSGHKKDCIVCSGNARQDDALVESERLYHERLFKAYAPDTVVAFGHEAQVVYSRFAGDIVLILWPSLDGKTGRAGS